MSFSSEVKEEISNIYNFKEQILKAELTGYILSGNMFQNENTIQFITENEFNIEHLYKILFNLNIQYEPEIKGKCYLAIINKNKEVQEIINNYNSIYKSDIRKSIIKGVFLGSGSINNPNKNYHLEIAFNNESYSQFILQICEEYEIHFKKINVNEKYQLYLKDGEEISKFLALIGANRSVLKFEDIRVMKDMKNNVNRKVNCETANLNKTVDAALKQIDDINYIKKMNKFNELPQKLKDIANLRLENPDLSLQDLSELIQPPIRKIYSKS